MSERMLILLGFRQINNYIYMLRSNDLNFFYFINNVSLIVKHNDEVIYKLNGLNDIVSFLAMYIK